MVLFAAWASARRAGNVPRAFVVATVAVRVAAVATLGLLLVLGVVPATARYLIPLGGMVIGNSLNAALALGATSRQAVAPILKAALQSVSYRS
jgi:putative ABC transport system permease protein